MLDKEIKVEASKTILQTLSAYVGGVEERKRELQMSLLNLSPLYQIPIEVVGSSHSAHAVRCFTVPS